MKTIALILALSLPAHGVMQYHPPQPQAHQQSSSGRSHTVPIIAGAVAVVTAVVLVFRAKKRKQAKKSAYTFYAYETRGVNKMLTLNWNKSATTQDIGPYHLTQGHVIGGSYVRAFGRVWRFVSLEDWTHTQMMQRMSHDAPVLRSIEGYHHKGGK